jgi:hypothetical protein
VWVNREAHDAIVPRDLWLAAQLDHPRPVRNGRVPVLLRGLVRCAGCSCRMSIEAVRGRRYYSCKPRNRAGGGCPSTAQISQAKLDEWVERLVLPHIESIEYAAARRGQDLDETMNMLREAEDELAAFQQAIKVADIGPEVFAAGMRSRVEAVKLAQRAVAEARAGAGDLPQGTLAERWAGMSVEERGQLLSRSLGAVFVRKGRGVSADRVKVLAAGFEPDALPGHHGRRRVVPRRFEWVEDMPGEVTVPSP